MKIENTRDLQPAQQSISIIDSIDVGAIQETMKKIAMLKAVVQQTLKQGHDFGIVPGTNKPTLHRWK